MLDFAQSPALTARHLFMNQGSDFPGQPQATNSPNRGCARAIVAMLIFIAFGFLGGMAASIACNYFPAQYYSQVIMEMKPVSPALDPGAPFQPVRDPNFQAAQFRILQSKEILYPVIHELKLAETWGVSEGQGELPKEEAYARLLQMLKLEPVRNTDLVGIGVFSKDRTEAANIANRIAVTYQRVLQGEQMKRRDEALAQLQGEVNAQRQATAKAREATKSIAAEDGYIDPAPEEISSSATLTVDSKPPVDAAAANHATPRPSQRYQAAKADYLKAKRVLEAAETRLSTEKVQLKMTVIPATIWEKAEPSTYPTHPSMAKLVGGNFAGGIGTGLVAAALFLFFTRPRRLPPNGNA